MFVQYLRDYIIGKKKKYTFLIISIYSIITSILPAYNLITKSYPVLKNFPSFSKDIVEEIYPQELELKIENGKLTSNVNEPYYLTIKVSRLRQILDSFSPNSGKNLPDISSIRLLTIDTKASVEDYYQYQTLLLLTKENFVYQDESDIKFYALSNLGDLTINKDFIRNKLNEYLNNSTLKFIFAYGVFILIPLLPILTAITFILTTLFFSMFAYLMARVMQTGITYRQIFAWLTLVNSPIVLMMAFAGEMGRIPQFIVYAINDLSTLVILALAYIVLKPLKGAILKNETNPIQPN